MEDKFSYFFAEKAEKDLDNILNYISIELSNKTAAIKFRDKLFEKIDVVRAFPLSGFKIDNAFIEQDVYRFLVDNYTIYYIFDNDKREICILRIIYSKRDMNKILNEL